MFQVGSRQYADSNAVQASLKTCNALIPQRNTNLTGRKKLSKPGELNESQVNIA